MERDSRETFSFFLEEEKKKFSGWDFSHLTKTRRKQEFPLSWNYYNEIRHYARQARALLDMNTGGGEFLSQLDYFPPRTVATEGYPPNIEIARNRLKPQGIELIEVEGEGELPFAAGEFDLIINRHADFRGEEISRVLEQGGHFITQQVGGLNDLELNLLLQAPECEFSGWNLQVALELLGEQGLEVVKSREDITKTRFYDIGAIIFHLQAVPWQVPDFSVEKYQEELFTLHEHLENQGFMDLTCHRFFLILRKE